MMAIRRITTLLAALAATAKLADAQCGGTAPSHECAMSKSFFNAAVWGAGARSCTVDGSASSYDGLELVLQDETAASDYTVEIFYESGSQDTSTVTSVGGPAVEFLPVPISGFGSLAALPEDAFVAIAKNAASDVVACLKHGVPTDAVLNLADCELTIGGTVQAGDVWGLKSPDGASSIKTLPYRGEVAADFEEASIAPADSTNCQIGSVNPDQGFIGSNSAAAFINEILDVKAGDCAGDASSDYRGIEVAFDAATLSGDITLVVNEAQQYPIQVSGLGWKVHFQAISDTEVADMGSGSAFIVDDAGTVLNGVSWGSNAVGFALNVGKDDIGGMQNNYRYSVKGLNMGAPMDGEWEQSTDKCTPGVENDGQSLGGATATSTSSSSSSRPIGSSTTTTSGDEDGTSTSSFEETTTTAVPGSAVGRNASVITCALGALLAFVH